jgi:hypothetical protein
MLEPQGGVSEEMQVRKDVSGKKEDAGESENLLAWDAAGEAGRWQG